MRELIPIPFQSPSHYLGGWHRWYWGLVPLLAIVAYAPVLGVGFVSDDFEMLYRIQSTPASLQTLLPDPGLIFYRPMGQLLVWHLGWYLWGFNPLPFHLQGLILHAASSLILGLWLAEASSRRSLGWLAGALFAVFPLNLEAVGWVAAQWDTLAVSFGLLSLLFFTRYYRGATDRFSYVLSLLFYSLSVFSKESLAAFLPFFALSAWLVTPSMHGRDWRRLGYALLPYCVVLALNVGVRLFAWGRLGNYPSARIDYPEFFWDALIAYGRVLLSPINRALVGDWLGQVVGALSGAALVFGLVLYGRSRRRLLLIAGGWVLLAILPVLNLPVYVDTLQDNRFLYFASAGYCVGMAVLLHEGVASARNWRRVALALVGVVLLLSIFTCWVQLAPWRIASTQVSQIGNDLLRLIPKAPRPQGLVWYIENGPDHYQGAYILRNGLGQLRHFLGGDFATVIRVQNAGEAPLTSDSRDAFALRFRFDEASTRFLVDYAAGITSESGPPSPSEAGDTLKVWDFTQCENEVLQAWDVVQAQARCEEGKGLVLDPTGPDVQMVGTNIAIALAGRADFVRLRASVRYPSAIQPEAYVSEWFWRGADTDWSAEHSKSMPIKQDGKPHVYWTFIPAAEAGRAISGLRFDPVNSVMPSEVQWIAVDLVR